MRQAEGAEAFAISILYGVKECLFAYFAPRDMYKMLIVGICSEMRTANYFIHMILESLATHVKISVVSRAQTLVPRSKIRILSC